MNSSKIDSLVNQVVDRHKKLVNARRLAAKNNKCKQKDEVNGRQVAIVVIFYICFVVTLLTTAGILIAKYGHSCCCC